MEHLMRYINKFEQYSFPVNIKSKSTTYSLQQSTKSMIKTFLDSRTKIMSKLHGCAEINLPTYIQSVVQMPMV